MKAWNVTEMEIEPHHPLVLDTEDEGRVIAINLPAGESLQEHQVHERAWLMVASGTIEVDDAQGESVGGGAGLIATFNPKERHEVRAKEDSLLLLLLAPWPGEGHPSQPGERAGAPG